MEGKNRTLFVVLIAIVIVVAVFSSFGLNFFGPDIPEINLPDVTVGETPAPGSQGNDTDRYLRVDVTPDTVQSVIRTMVPLQPESYHRSISIQTALGDGTMTTTTNQVWVDFGWTQVQSTWPNGVVEHSILGDGRAYRWFGGDRNYKSWAASEREANMAQRIPTYEDVLALNKKQITDTGYTDLNGTPCIYVEVAENELGNREAYWVSVETGLLLAAETRKGEELLLSMASGTLERPVAQGTSFSLPDGTRLHTCGATGSSAAP
ncbi:MAG: hypothetical protein RR403_00550 [Pseudoflavonifractor sp.]